MSGRWEREENVKQLRSDVDELTLALRVGAVELDDDLAADLVFAIAHLSGALVAQLDPAQDRLERTTG